MAFELVQKPLQCDMATRQVKRKSEKTKNELMRQMIHACLQNALQFRFVLMDSWFASEENFDFITGRGKHFIAALKDNRLVALSQEDWKKKRFVRVGGLEFSEPGTVQGWLKGSARAVRLVRQAFKNQERSTGRLHLVCSDLTCDYDAIPLDLQKMVASGGVTQILEVQRRHGQVANANVENAKQPRLHGHLCRFQTRMLERQKQDKPFCFTVQASHQCHPQRF